MAVATALEHDLNIRSTLFGALLVAAPSILPAAIHVVVVEGLGGDPVYTNQFGEQIDAIEAAAESVTSSDRIRVFRVSNATRKNILDHFESMRTNVSKNDQVTLYLVGHGSYDDYEYKFNLPGPDLTGEDIAQALDGLPGANQLLVNTSSASGAIIDLLAANDRVLVVATRSGVERHATRFGGYFAAALSNSSADTDKNQLITAAEAFSYAQRQVTDYFERNGQLATEHARIEGERTSRVSLARLGDARPDVVDDDLADLVADRDELNSEIEALRLSRDDLPFEEYQAQLLQKMLELAQIEDAIEVREMELDDEK